MIDMYDETTLAVGRDMAIGSFAKQFRDIDAMEVDSSPVDLGDDFDELMNGSKTASSTMPSKKRSHKRCKCSDMDDKYATLSTQIGEMASAMKALNQTTAEYYKISNDVMKAEYSKLYNEVMKVDEHDELTLGLVFDYLVENEKIANAFMVTGANLQKASIDKFVSKGEHN